MLLIAFANNGNDPIHMLYSAGHQFLLNPSFPLIETSQLICIANGTTGLIGLVISVNIYLFKVNNRNTRNRGQMFSSISIVDLEQVNVTWGYLLKSGSHLPKTVLFALTKAF